MATLHTVISFDDHERAVLAGEAKNRTAMVKALSTSFNRQIKSVFDRSAQMADANPHHGELAELKSEIGGVRRVLEVLPDSQESGDLSSALNEVLSVVDEAIAALPPQH